MSGKKKISFPISMEFKTGRIEFFNRAEETYALHKERIDRIIEALNGELTVGYVKRERKKLSHGINAHSVNDSLRESLKEIEGLHTENSVVYGSFLPQNNSGAFDFCIYDKETNFYNFWNHCYGKSAVYNGCELYDKYINTDELQSEWREFIDRVAPVEHENHLEIPQGVFNVIGEIQCGNWALVYKDMFRLVSAINQGAKVDLYVYITITGNLQELLSDGCVNFDSAKKEFKENVDNHNITNPIMMIPIDVDIELKEYDFSLAEEGYDEIVKEMNKLEHRHKKAKEKLNELKQQKRNMRTNEEKLWMNKKIINKKKHIERIDESLKQIKNKYKFIED